MVGDRALAEDLLQDRFHDALRSRAQLPAVRNQEAWLYGIARNPALQALRKRRRFNPVLIRLGGREATSGDDREIVAVRDLLARTLSPEDRVAVLSEGRHDIPRDGPRRSSRRIALGWQLPGLRARLCVLIRIGYLTEPLRERKLLVSGPYHPRT